MEQLKSLIPNDLSRMISESTAETLARSCSSLLEFLLPLPQFRRIIGDLTDPELALCRKCKEKALDFKKIGNECFSRGDYLKALSFYSQALRCSPTTNDDVDESFVATLYVNRASSMHKMALLEECIRDCNRAIVLSPAYAKMNNLILNCNVSQRQLKVEDWFLQLTSHQPHYYIVKNLLLRDMQIVMKSCRETHCHFCFNEVPADVVFCSSCTIPIYCSQHCQEQAGGEQFVRNQNLLSVQENLPADLANHFMETALAGNEKCEIRDVNFKHIHEHRHECGGAHWPAVLPPDIVLAGRVMVKFKEERKLSEEICKSVETVELSHNYNQNSPENKVELHLYAIVLSYCLKHDYDLDFPSVCNSSSELVLLISKIKVNSMAIVRMKSIDGYEEFQKSPMFPGIDNAFTISVKQVQVGKAIYATGSLFNHSCQPNIHAYFLSRTLFLRSTEFVPAWYPLELSYGPQVGQLTFRERQELLKEHYSFKCQCRGCSELNLSDIVINAFCCYVPNCVGAVLDVDQHIELEESFPQESTSSFNCTRSLPQKEEISKVANMLVQNSSIMSQIAPEHCLTCGSYHHLESLRESLKCAMMDIEKLKDCMSSEATGFLVLDTLKSLSNLRSIRHPYSKIVAQAEDTIAEAFVRVGKFEHARLHCEVSIKILEKLYGTNHIVIGHELLKLVSVQLSLGDHASALCNIQRLETIFSLYYGPHTTVIFPYLTDLRREADSGTP